MKIIATLKGYRQCGENNFEDYRHSYEFESSDSIDFMLEKTGVKELSELNLSEKKEWVGTK